MKQISRVRCVRGHDLNEKSTYFPPNSNSYTCKLCSKISSKKYLEKERLRNIEIRKYWESKE